MSIVPEPSTLVLPHVFFTVMILPSVRNTDVLLVTSPIVYILHIYNIAHPCFKFLSKEHGILLLRCLGFLGKWGSLFTHTHTHCKKSSTSMESENTHPICTHHIRIYEHVRPFLHTAHVCVLPLLTHALY